MEKGFTLLEMLIVISFTFVLALTGSLVTSAIVRSQSLLDATHLLASQLTLTQIDAYSQLDDQSHGVKIFSDSVVRFTGDSYEMRDVQKDSVISLAPSLTISGDLEIIFAKGELAPTQAASVTLLSGNAFYLITVSSYGTLQLTKGIL